MFTCSILFVYMYFMYFMYMLCTICSDITGEGPEFYVNKDMFCSVLLDFLKPEFFIILRKLCTSFEYQVEYSMHH